MNKQERKEIIDKVEAFVGKKNVLYMSSKNTYTVRARRIATWLIVCRYENIAEAATFLGHSARTVRERVSRYPAPTAENRKKYIDGRKKKLSPEEVNDLDARLRGLRRRKKVGNK